MKKVYLSLCVATFLLMSFVPFPDSQLNSDATLLEINMDPESLTKGEWGPWTQTDCFRRLDFRVKYRGKNYDNTKHIWGVQFRNRYNDKINFNYEVYDSKPSNGRSTNRKDLKSQEISDGIRDFYMKNGNSIYVYVDKVRFGKDGLQEYAPCDR